MPEAPTPLITPIAAHVHWDDVKAQWTIKASRQEHIGTKYKEWEGLLEKAITLAEVLALLLQFWGMVGSASVGSTPGDLAALGARMVAGEFGATYAGPPEVHASTEYEGTELLGDEYDGTDYTSPTLFWGATPAPH